MLSRLHVGAVFNLYLARDVRPCFREMVAHLEPIAALERTNYVHVVVDLVYHVFRTELTHFDAAPLIT